MSKKEENIQTVRHLLINLHQSYKIVLKYYFNFIYFKKGECKLTQDMGELPKSVKKLLFSCSLYKVIKGCLKSGHGCQRLGKVTQKDSKSSSELHQPSNLALCEIVPTFKACRICLDWGELSI